MPAQTTKTAVWGGGGRGGVLFRDK